MAEGICSVEGCARPIQSRGWCQGHYKQWLMSLPFTPLRPRGTGTPEERWRQRVLVVPSGCWEWQGGRMPKGYGQFTVNGRRVYPHRFSWELHHGPIPDGMFVCHHCDNPPCVNPDHLFLGTMTDNIRDAWAKGRGFAPGPYVGEDHPRAMITEDTVRAIRADSATGLYTRQQIADRHGCTIHVAADILRGKNWRHVI